MRCGVPGRRAERGRAWNLLEVLRRRRVLEPGRAQVRRAVSRDVRREQTLRVVRSKESGASPLGRRHRRVQLLPSSNSVMGRSKLCTL